MSSGLEISWEEVESLYPLLRGEAGELDPSLEALARRMEHLLYEKLSSEELEELVYKKGKTL